MTPSTAPTATVNTLASWAILFPPQEFGLPHGRLTETLPRTRAGFPRSTCARPGRGGCRLYPGGGGVHATDQVTLVAACRFSAASPCTPAPQSIYPGLTLTRRHRRFTHVHPSDLPLTRSPRMDRGPLRLSPEAYDSCKMLRVIKFSSVLRSQFYKRCQTVVWGSGKFGYHRRLPTGARFPAVALNRER